MQTNADATRTGYVLYKALVDEEELLLSIIKRNKQLMKDHGPKRSVSQIIPTTFDNAQQQFPLVNNNVVMSLYSIKVLVVNVFPLMT